MADLIKNSAQAQIAFLEAAVKETLEHMWRSFSALPGRFDKWWAPSTKGVKRLHTHRDSAEAQVNRHGIWSA